VRWNPSLVDGPIEVHRDGELLDGYHLNIAPWLMTDDLAAYAVTPENPVRIFAGGSTGWLKFPDEATARALLADYWIEDETEE
jgi:hypothetical protein